MNPCEYCRDWQAIGHRESCPFPRIAAVRALHHPIKGGDRIGDGKPMPTVCDYCTSGGDPYCYPEEADTYPCPTIRLLDGTVEP